MQERFEQAFWCEDLSSYALALDGDKRPCRVRASNAGHCLFTGIAGHERARRVAATLLGPESFSGWGVRTVAASESRYNPMSYHTGSVWPHDNALIAQGLSRYGLTEKSLQIWNGLFAAGMHFESHRMPELFCGFPQDAGEGPVLYPVACARRPGRQRPCSFSSRRAWAWRSAPRRLESLSFGHNCRPRWANCEFTT